MNCPLCQIEMARDGEFLKCPQCGLRSPQQSVFNPSALLSKGSSRQISPSLHRTKSATAHFPEADNQALHEQIAYLGYVRQCNLPLTMCREVEEYLSNFKTPVWSLLDFARLMKWYEADQRYQILQSEIKAVYGSRGDEERQKYLKDYQGLISDMSLLCRKWILKKKFRSVMAPKVLGSMLEYFLKDIRKAYPVTTDHNNPGKGLAAGIEALFPGVRLRQPTTFDQEVNTAALRLRKLGHDEKQIIDHLDYVIRRLSPPSQIFPSRYRETLARRISKAIRQNSHIPS